MTDHNCLWWSCCSTCVNEGATITWLLFIHPALKLVFLLLRVVLIHTDFDKLIPCKNFFFHLCWDILWNWVFPDYEVFNFRYLVENFSIFFELSSILQNHNFAFRMISNIFTSLWGVGSVDTDWEIVPKNRSRKSNCPFLRVESNNIYGCVIVNS